MTDPVDLGRSLEADDLAEESDASDRGRLTFLEHLDELRKRLIYSLYALIACCAVAFFFWQDVYAYFVKYFSSYGGKLIYNQPMAGSTANPATKASPTPAAMPKPTCPSVGRTIPSRFSTTLNVRAHGHPAAINVAGIVHVNW